ncbi:MAG: FAD-binding protein [Bacteroides sp.]|nr:FAD-binding protein [Bacteroides sp.]MCM1549380.1 FAD-dependent oxidoreductase [Clostridium sp.]
MGLRINQIKLPVLHEKKDLDQAVRQAIHRNRVPEYTIVKQSIDARDKNRLRYIYSVELSDETLDARQLSRILTNKNIMVTEKAEYDFNRLVSSDSQATERKPLLHPPVIVGTGPAGLFCGYQLAKAGYQPILIERGLPVEERCRQIQDYWQGGELNPECNVQFGEGGAGTYSDGKLNTTIRDRAGRIDEVLRTFVEFGAPADICYVNKPHIGTDLLQTVVRNMRRAILELGGQVWFDTCLVDFQIRPDSHIPTGVLQGVTLRQQGELRDIPCESLVLAIGHSARDTFSLLQDKGIDMTPKAFAVGLRIEHPAEMIQASQYGTSREAEALPAADYKLTHQTKEGRAVYSFCMCPGGHIVDASSQPEHVAVNGMSYRSRKGRNSNSAIVVNVTPEDFADCGPLAGIAFQEKWEHAAWRSGQGRVPLQLFGDYQAHRPSTSLGGITPELKGRYAFADLNDCLPKFVNNAIISGIMSFEHRIHGFAREDSILCGIESRTSSPVRIQRDSAYNSNIGGIFPCGEGAGYAGGITSAAVDGIKVAEAIAGQYVPGY